MLYAQVNEQMEATIQAEMRATQDKKWFLRLKIIALSGAGESVPTLAQLFELSQATIRNYIHAFDAEGIPGLRPNYGKGRPPKLNWTQDEWLDVISQSPQTFQYLQTSAQNWTQALLKEYLAHYHQIDVSQPVIARNLKRVRIRWRRARLRVHSPDPLYIVKRQRLKHLQQMALAGKLTSDESAHRRSDEPPKQAYLVYLDSTDLHWCPDVGPSYTPVGVQLKVDSPGYDNPWYALFGSLFYPSGEGLYTIHKRKRSAEFLYHLNLLLEYDSDAFWFVVLDNASAHTAEPVQAFAQAHQDQLELVYLPTYSPHLNLIERLWHFMRGELTRNIFYDNLPALARAVVQWLDSLPFAQLCSLMGLDESQLVFVEKPFA